MFRASMAGFVMTVSSGVLLGQGHVNADDLNPVRVKPAPQHPPINLVLQGQAKASIAVMAKGGSPELI